MVFSDSTNQQGLIQDISFLTGVDTNKYSVKHRTRNINEWNRKVLTWVFDVYGGWQFDDDNNSAVDDMPTGTVSLVSGTSTYALPAGVLTVRKVDVIQSDGTTSVSLYPQTLEQINVAEAELLDSNGTPRYYRLVGDVIKLYPAPDYDGTNALKVFFDRDMSQFVITDTTKTPGFASPFHRVLSLGSSLDYAISTGDRDKINSFERQVMDFENRIKKFYSKRFCANFPNKIRVTDSLQQYK